MANYIDMELLISEVEKRPALWDTSDEDYKDKNKENLIWNEICSCLFENYDTIPEIQQKFAGRFNDTTVLYFFKMPRQLATIRHKIICQFVRLTLFVSPRSSMSSNSLTVKVSSNSKPSWSRTKL